MLERRHFAVIGKRHPPRRRRAAPPFHAKSSLRFAAATRPWGVSDGSCHGASGRSGFIPVLSSRMLIAYAHQPCKEPRGHAVSPRCAVLRVLLCRHGVPLHRVLRVAEDEDLDPVRRPTGETEAIALALLAALLAAAPAEAIGAPVTTNTTAVNASAASRRLNTDILRPLLFTKSFAIINETLSDAGKLSPGTSGVKLELRKFLKSGATMANNEQSSPTQDADVRQGRRITLTGHCRTGWRLSRNRFESSQRADRRLPRHADASRTAPPRARLSQARLRCRLRRGADDRAGLPRARERRGRSRSSAGSSGVTNESGVSLILTESGDRHSPGHAWIDGCGQAPSDRRDPRVLRPRPPRRSTSSAAVESTSSVVDPADEPEPDVASIGSATWAGGFAAAQHLIDLGHRRIGMISGPEDMLCSIARVDGFRSALERSGISFDPGLVRAGDFHVTGGHAAAEALLDLTEPPTAIFAGSDLQALGVYEAARPRGVRIPDDLSVVGYDDLRLARWAGPPLTHDSPAADRDGGDGHTAAHRHGRGAGYDTQPAHRSGHELGRA